MPGKWHYLAEQARTSTRVGNADRRSHPSGVLLPIVIQDNYATKLLLFVTLATTDDQINNVEQRFKTMRRVCKQCR